MLYAFVAQLIGFIFFPCRCSWSRVGLPTASRFVSFPSILLMKSIWESRNIWKHSFRLLNALRVTEATRPLQRKYQNLIEYILKKVGNTI